MKNIFIVVEGYSELEFVNNLLAPYLIQSGADIVKPYPVATNAALGKKGGGKYKHLREELLRSVKYSPEKIVSTFFDYYAFPADAPDYAACKQGTSVDERILCLEQAIKNDIAPNNHRFIPYLQKHEFEALLFSSNDGFKTHYNEIAEETGKIINQYPNPEEINDNPATAPSKRILNFIPSYNKVLHGNILALEIGIETILERCPRFHNWIEMLINSIK